MNEDECKSGCIIFVMIAFVVLSVAFFITRSMYRTEAVERGYAEWKVTTDGTTTWQWVEPNKQEKSQ